MSEKYYLKTYGCQMNFNDSETIDSMMEKHDYVKTDLPEKADIIIFNTCCVREGVDFKVYGRLGDYKRLKRENPSLLIVVCGCLAQKDGEDLFRRAPHIDLVLGPNQLGKLTDYIVEVKHKGKHVLHTEWNVEKPDVLPNRENKVSAWVSISYGCDNYCAYCIVPFVRGPERSRPVKEIIGEIEKLAKEGYKEVTLLGQNVNTYGKGLEEPADFPFLLHEVSKIDGIDRIRFTTSHPRDFKFHFVDTISSLPKVCNWFHLPLQAGDDDVLKNMNRGYTVGDYTGLVEHIRSKIPDASLSTDLIVGFPGETEEQFENTLKTVEKIEFDQAFMFKYSIRSGTKGAEMKDQIDEEIKAKRLNRLIDIQNKIMLRKNISKEGKTLEVLVDGITKKKADRFSGRTGGNKLVAFDGLKDCIGQLVNVKIEKAFTWGLVGKQV